MPSEKELDLLLAAKLEAEPEFLHWFVGFTKFADRGAVFKSCRSNHPWGTHPFPVEDPATGEKRSSNRQSETDVLLVLQDNEGGLFGVHIENKLGTGKFTKLQPEMYPHRAEHWINNPRYGGYVDFDIVLLAPEAFLKRHPDQASLFPHFVSHEAVAKFIPQFGVANAAS